jgi:hypothetical protein
MNPINCLLLLIALRASILGIRWRPRHTSHESY